MSYYETVAKELYQLGSLMPGTSFLHRFLVGGSMVRKPTRKLLSIAFILSIGSLTHAESINKCLWAYSETAGKVKILNDIALNRLQNKKQMSVTSKRGDIVTFDFIPGSPNQEPIIINGGLWYKIQYFDMFNGILTSQSLLKETLLDESKNQLEMIQGYLAKGHPIVIVARATQPESIYTSLKNNVIPSFDSRLRVDPNPIYRKMKPATSIRKSLALKDHADDIVSVITQLRSEKKISSSAKIQLASLSYGVNVLREFKGLNEDLILHSTIIAPLAFAGDNYKDATEKQTQMIKMAQMGLTPYLFNPLTAGYAKVGQDFIKSYIQSLSEHSYSKKLIDNAFANDPELQAREKEFPGYKKLVQEGLANDMEAARMDIFQLGDPKYFHLYKNTTLIFAGDEEPSRLKAQISAFIKMKETLKEEAPNLIFMDDAQHATTATAPIQTANMFSTMMLHDVAKSEGAIFYMHRLDKEAKPRALNKELFEILTEEVNREAIGPDSVSQLEVLFFPEIFSQRLLMTANSVKDLTDVLQLQGKKPLPSDFKDTPDRPYLKFQYMDLTAEQKQELQKHVHILGEKLQEYVNIQKKAEETLQKLQAKSANTEKK